MNARDIMTAYKVWACSETSDARQVGRLMAEHDVGAIPVLDPDGRLEGIVTDRDLCCKVIATGRDLDVRVRKIMSKPVHAVRPDDSLERIESIMREHKIRRVPVVDSDNRLQGFISMADLACHCSSPEEEHELVGVLETVSRPGRMLA